MLVLGRKTGQQIVLGDDITVTVVKIESNWVRLGIEAPAEVPIHRKEIRERIQRESEAPDAN